MNNARVG